MATPSYEEMEAKRQEMIASFREVAAAMTRCVQKIEDYTIMSPGHLSKPDFAATLASAHPLALLPNGQLVSDVMKKERKKKDKKPKDPNAPKRPPSAYILFQNEIRDDVRNSNPGMTYKDILGVISQKWKELTDAQRKVYEDSYSSRHNEYVAEEKAYSAKPQVNAVPAPMIDPALDDDTSDSDDSDSDDTPPAKSKLPTNPLSHAQMYLNPGMQGTPSTLHAATAGVPMPSPAEKKKEKKRKNKEDEAAVAATLAGDANGDKKKKKKSKD
ncbi:hypothetical protein IAU60_004501 [Kwoniella sp. DSM 27419]